MMRGKEWEGGGGGKGCVGEEGEKKESNIPNITKRFSMKANKRLSIFPTRIQSFSSK